MIIMKLKAINGFIITTLDGEVEFEAGDEVSIVIDDNGLKIEYIPNNYSQYFSIEKFKGIFKEIE